MKKKIIIVSGIILLILIVGLAEPFILDDVPGEFQKPIALALAQTDSVALSYCEREASPDSYKAIEVSDKDFVVLNPVEQNELKSLLKKRHFFFGYTVYPRCWEPHHVIRLKLKDGTKFDIYVCFTCLKYQVEGLRYRTIPKTLCESLEKIFIAKGFSKNVMEKQ